MTQLLQRILIGTLMIGLGLIGVGAAFAPAAQASSGVCSSKTGGSNNWLIKADNASSSSWNCAYTTTTGNESIGGYDTVVVTRSSEDGYAQGYKCHTSSSSVSMTESYTYGGGKLPSSITWGATNGSVNSQNWTGAMLWNTTQASSNPLSGQYVTQCADDTIEYNQFEASTLSWSCGNCSVTSPQYVNTRNYTAKTTFNVSVTVPSGTVTSGQVGLYHMNGTSPDPTVDKAIGGGSLASGKITISASIPEPGEYYFAYGGNDWTSMDPTSGITGATPTMSDQLWFQPSDVTTCVDKYPSNTEITNTMLLATNSSGQAVYLCAYVDSVQKSFSGNGNSTTMKSTGTAGFSKLDVCTGSTNTKYVSVTSSYDPADSPTSQADVKFTGTNISTSSQTMYGSVLWVENGGTVATGQEAKACMTFNTNYFYPTSGDLIAPSSIVVNQPVAMSMNLTSNGGPTVNGVYMVLYQQLGAFPSPSTDTSLGKGLVSQGAGSVSFTPTSTTPITVYAVITSTSSTVTPPTVGTSSYLSAPVLITPAATKTAGKKNAGTRTSTRLSQKTARIVNGVSTPVVVREVHGKGVLSVKCPRATAIQTMHAGSTKRTFAAHHYHSFANFSGIKVKAHGKKSYLQVVCRSVHAPVSYEDHLARGSVAADVMAALSDDFIITGGFGADELSSQFSNSILSGGFGSDSITLTGDASQADGGPGDDQLSASGSGDLLVGGLGKDILRGSSKATRINALDGSGADVVFCGSARNRVVADAGDRIIGPCRVLRLK